MSTYTFTPKVSTQIVNWNDPTVWVGGVVPNAADADVVFPTVTTSGGSIYWSVVSINSGESFSTRSISLSNNDLLTTGNLTVAGDFALHTGGEFRVFGGSLSVGSLENDGTDIAGSGQIIVSGLFSNASQLDGFNGNLTVTAASLNNTGSIIASSTSPNLVTLNVPGGGFTNLSGSTLTGGTYQTGSPFVAASGALNLNVGGVIATDAANISLYGGDIASYDTTSSSFVPLESTLQTIASSGTLTLGVHTFNWRALTVDGALVLSAVPSASNPVLNSSHLVVDASGHVSGVGTIGAPITNDGVIISNALKINGAVVGSGMIEVAAGGTLELNGPVSQAVVFLDNAGILTLDQPSSFVGSISAPAAGDEIVLPGVSLNSVIGYHYSGDQSGGVLTLHLSSGDIQLNFSGHFSTQSFTVSAGDQPLSTSPPSLVIREEGFVSPPSDANAIPDSINNDGDIVGSYTDDNGVQHGFLKSGGAYVEVPIIGLPSKSQFYGINDSGDIVGTVTGPTAQTPFGFHQTISGFIYHDGGVSLYSTGAEQTNFESINNNGQVVGYSTNPDDFDPHFPGQKYNGFIFQNGTFQAFGAANDTLPYGLNDEGQIVGNFLGDTHDVVSSTRLPSVGFRYDPGGAGSQTFNAPSASQTFARDINDAGVIVGYYDSSSGTHGFAYYYSTGVWTPIDAPGAVATYIYGINDLDQIVGAYVDHSGISHGFVGTVPPPFPSSPGNIDEWILSNGQWEASAAPGPHPGGYRVALVADFSGDGTSDILWQNVNTGAVDLWKISNGGWAGSVDLGTHPGAGWQIAGAGDFNRDGTSDVLWFNPGSGQTDIWQLSNGQWSASVQPGPHPLGYQVAGIGDFNRDGTSDILWYNPTSGNVDEWNIVNGHWAGSNNLGAHPGSGWQIAGVGDFNNDGASDVFWYNAASGQTDIWELANGQWLASVSPGNHPTGYQVAGIGDFNGDGTSDVLWSNPSTGATEIWLLANNHVFGVPRIQWAGSVDLGAHPGSGWAIAGIGDFTGSGTSDVLWHQFV